LPRPIRADLCPNIPNGQRSKTASPHACRSNTNRL
jgi:hypothetical protein